MERFTQFRDRGTGVSPFMPVKSKGSIFTKIFQSIAFLFRLPIFIAYSTVYFLVLQFLPLPQFLRKLLLWVLLAIPGIWWVDLQLDGVRRGTLSSQPASRVPRGGDVLAANFTSPVDAIYLSAVFDPVFTQSFPGTRKVQCISLLSAALRALSPVTLSPPDESALVDIADLQRKHRNRIILVFPECATTNGTAVLPLSPSVVSSKEASRIFPISLRYLPNNTTTPVPGSWGTFLFSLLCHSTIRIHVRMAEAVINTVPGEKSNEGPVAYDEEEVISKVCDALSRLGRSAKVGLTLKDKQAFTKSWYSKK
ncbi:Lysophosphatidic acid:oleoyl-CoA acyltransferase 1 [Ceratocystis pirilliformis]|uniref:Lysophosphatidic acid:oleoyl-CoA acyltransferase 1 n=1 Tax=Ceratocystis pirilliformis TaxID=259994 RepID=A0ABR3YHV3_9PEZI